ncbi:MAG: SagB family peptide dehydrogenase [Actinomycetota bacterium]|nr:SagB family peptide dehydrogenase [Actinomycetota bacterium]
MLADVARDFHDRTKHSTVSVRSGGRRMDPSNRPLPVKRYPELEPIALPVDWEEPEIGAAAVLAGQAAPDARPVDLTALARLLFLCAGVTRTVRFPEQTLAFRAAPSAGALYPIEVYVACADLPDLPAGLYHLEPIAFALHRLRDGDVRGALSRAAASDEVARAPLSLVLTGIPWRTTWKYGARGYRHLFWDAGTILSNATVATGAAGWPLHVVTGFVDERVSHLLGLGPPTPFTELPLAVVPVGPRRDHSAPDRELALVDHVVTPLSRQEIPEPDALAAHHAGDLADREAVSDWRRHLIQLAPERASATPGVPDAAAGTVEEVILRRGSTRRFDLDAHVPRDLLDFGLAAAARPPGRDTAEAGAGWTQHLVAVHAVTGVDAGAYRWTAAGLERLAADIDRRRTAHLCLDQPLGGSSAFTTFHSARLDPLLGAGGARAYRVVQLEAGIAAGRLQLASFALGAGGTGLTFYDDEVRRRFETDAEPMLVTAIGVPDYEPSPGSRPDRARPLRTDPHDLLR